MQSNSCPACRPVACALDLLLLLICKCHEPILITTNTDPYDGYGYEIYHINPDGTLTLEKYYEEDYS